MLIDWCLGKPNVVSNSADLTRQVLSDPCFILVCDENLGERESFLDFFGDVYAAAYSNLYDLRSSRIVFADIFYQLIEHLVERLFWPSGLEGPRLAIILPHLPHAFENQLLLDPRDKLFRLYDLVRVHTHTDGAFSY